MNGIQAEIVDQIPERFAVSVLEFADGLCMYEEFVSIKEEKELIETIDNETWDTKLIRRTQQYGYIYDYTSKTASLKTIPIPTWCDFIIQRLIERKIFRRPPDQMIINEYQPGQGIFPHIDNINSFGDGIVSISLGSDIIMDFISATNPLHKKSIMLPKRSTISLYGPARYEWRHGIPARKSDKGIKRGRRISLTFRNMK
jgi:alkylated DNA repair dioxygenase AlkB